MVYELFRAIHQLSAIKTSKERLDKGVVQTAQSFCNFEINSILWFHACPALIAGQGPAQF